MQNRTLLLAVIILTAVCITGIAFYTSSRTASYFQSIESVTGYMEASDQQNIQSMLAQSLSDQKKAFMLVFVVALAGLLGLFVLTYFKIMVPLQTLHSAFNPDGSLDFSRITNNDEDSVFQQRIQKSEQFYRTVQQQVTALIELTQKCQQIVSEFTDSDQDNADIFSTQRDEVTRVVTAMTEMTATIQEVAKNASEASDASIHTHTESQDIKAMMSGCMQSITQLANEILQGANAVRVLEKDTDQIGTVLDVIRGIAEQTNLLALNAAIEAARAGDQGRGFAVVADEVRVLAQNSQQSTEEIQRMIKQLRVGTQSAVDAMEQSNATSQEGVSLVAEADSAMDSIASSSQTVCDLNAQIATAAQEQSLVAEEINRSMINISEVTEQISKRWYDRRAKRAAIQKAFDELVEQATRIRA